MEVNGKRVGQPIPVPADRFAGGMHVGVGGVGQMAIKFTKLRVRRLAENAPGQ